MLKYWEMTLSEYLESDSEDVRFSKQMYELTQDPMCAPEVSFSHYVHSMFEKGEVIPIRVIQSLPDWAQQWDWGQYPKQPRIWEETYSERYPDNAGDNLHFKWYKNKIRQAVKDGESVPNRVLSQFVGEKWASNAFFGNEQQ
jgi:hypothetical protein